MRIKLSEFKIENTAKCPYGEKIVLAALKKLKEKDLLSIGKTLEIIDWDLDNICISDKEKFVGKEPDDDYAVRMWNIRETSRGNLAVDFTFFRIIKEEHSSHGEELCSGTWRGEAENADSSS